MRGEPEKYGTSVADPFQPPPPNVLLIEQCSKYSQNLTQKWVYFLSMPLLTTFYTLNSHTVLESQVYLLQVLHLFKRVTLSH